MIEKLVGTTSSTPVFDQILGAPNVGVSQTAREIEKSLSSLRRPNASQEGRQEVLAKSKVEALFDSRAHFKVLISQIAMHLDGKWRERLFKQIDSLLDADEWAEEDTPPSIKSYRTLIRLLLLIRPTKKPGFGASHDGHILVTWTNGSNLLTVECLPNDQIQWSIVRSVAPGAQAERAVGKNKIERLLAILEPYQPAVWFNDAEYQPGQ
jgi:hypothetical protein